MTGERADERAEGFQGKCSVEPCGKQPPREGDAGAFAVFKQQA